MTQHESNAPTSKHLRATMDSFCSKELLSSLAHTDDDSNGSQQDDADHSQEDVIVVDRKSKAHRDRDEAERNNYKYAQEFRRNCFYQFKALRDTKGSFFGLNSDEEHCTTAPKTETT